jgi:hypothetical protein
MKPITVKAVGLYAEKSKWLGYVASYGRGGEWRTRKAAVDAHDGIAYAEDEILVDCIVTITPKKGKK